MATVARAIGVDLKWLDNLLSHHQLPGVQLAGRGVARQLDAEGVRLVAIIDQLVRHLGVPVSRAVALATDLAADARRDVSDALSVRINLQVLEASVRERMVEALETSTERRRGRPPRRAR